MTYVSSGVQKIGGLAAIIQAAIYIGMFVIYGAILSFPAASDSALYFSYLSDNQSLLFLSNLLGYVFFAILLLFLLLALHKCLDGSTSYVMQAASTFGVIWVGLVLASGMIANIGLAAIIKLAASDPDQAVLVSSVLDIVVEGLGGGNEIVGGMWMLLLSHHAFNKQLIPAPICLLGLVVGVAGVLSVYPLEIFEVIFGLGQIVWFLAIGIFLLRSPFQVK